MYLESEQPSGWAVVELRDLGRSCQQRSPFGTWSTWSCEWDLDLQIQVGPLIAQPPLLLLLSHFSRVRLCATP